MKCDECDTSFAPSTDAYRCPCCGAENYPDDDEPLRCVFTHCNVCGVRLRTADEDQMGMCERCANE